MIAPGLVVGDLTVERKLGEGSHAAIYKVRRADGQRHALKVLHTTDPTAAERLHREAAALRGLAHPNVVALERALTVEGRPALLLELVVGPTLGDWLDGGGPKTVDEALHLFRGVARGVMAIHAAGLVHRDLNPANVLLSVSGTKRVVPKITDFGTVLTRDGAALTGASPLGTPGYMAPEQIHDAHTATAASDQFALGCLLYELLTGERAFARVDLLSLHHDILARDVVPVGRIRPDVPDDVVAVVERMLSPEAGDRFADVGEVLEVLYLDDVPEITEDVLPGSFDGDWTSAPVSTQTAARVRELTPKTTVPAVMREHGPPAGRAAVATGLVALAIVAAALGFGFAAWWFTP